MKRRPLVLLLVVIIVLMSAVPAFASHQVGTSGKPPHPEIHQHRAALSTHPSNSAAIILLMAFSLVTVLLVTYAMSKRKESTLE